MGVRRTVDFVITTKAVNAAKRFRQGFLQSFGLEKTCIENLIRATKGFNISQSGSS